MERTQEFALKWATDEDGPLREIVRQQWNFSPQGATHVVENYTVDLPRVSVLELLLNPDIASGIREFGSVARNLNSISGESAQ
jgi:hypothetical protein